jgi:SAM-dependent methyltransferase
MLQPANIDDDVYRLRAEGDASLDVLRKSHEAAFPWYRTFLRPWLPKDLQSTILDVPCGAGNLLYTLRKLGYAAATGVDSEGGQVALAQRLGLPASQGDAFAAVRALGSNSVHRIFSLDFIEHLDRSRAVEFLRLAHDALVPGGFVVCRTPSADGPFGSHDRYNDLTHHWALTSTAAFPLMKLAGFEPEKVLIRQEAPVPYKFSNVVRRVMFHATTGMLGAFLDVVGIGAPAVWTRSMWIIGQK